MAQAKPKINPLHCPKCKANAMPKTWKKTATLYPTFYRKCKCCGYTEKHGF